MPGRPARQIAIGDVHGCAHALDAVLAAIEPHADDQIVFLGDLIDQGRDTPDVIERILELRKSCDVVVITGNHEEMMLAARENEKALRYWEVCGGVNTLNSYRYGGTLAEVPRRHWDLIEQALPYYETDEFIFTHANYLPDVPLSEQPLHQLRWALLEPSEARPHFSGKTVFVGHTEQRSGEVLDLDFLVCLDTACWRHGWLTAMDVRSRELWQASRFGMLRDPHERPQRERLAPLIAVPN